MSERQYQASDVYNATKDIVLYTWVAGLEDDLQKARARIAHLEGQLRAVVTGADLHPGPLPDGLANALPSLRASLSPPSTNGWNAAANDPLDSAIPHPSINEDGGRCPTCGSFEKEWDYWFSDRLMHARNEALHPVCPDAFHEGGEG